MAVVRLINSFDYSSIFIENDEGSRRAALHGTFELDYNIWALAGSSVFSGHPVQARSVAWI